MFAILLLLLGLLSGLGHLLLQPPDLRRGGGWRGVGEGEGEETMCMHALSALLCSSCLLHPTSTHSHNGNCSNYSATCNAL